MVSWRSLLVAFAVEANGLELNPLAEPGHEDFFGGRPVERVREISPSDFDERVRLGKPFVIEDAGQSLDLVGTSCQQFHERFPSAKMRAEYTGSRNEEFVSLGSKAWFQKDRPQQERLKPKSKDLQNVARANAPYVWHVKDGGHEAPPGVRAAVQKAWQPPYFVRGAVNLREANESAEFWFHRRNGAVLAHADTYCIPAVSLQITGKKCNFPDLRQIHMTEGSTEPIGDRFGKLQYTRVRHLSFFQTSSTRRTCQKRIPSAL